MTALLTSVMCLCCVVSVVGQKKEGDRLKESADVLKEIMAMPEKEIPKDLLDAGGVRGCVSVCQKGRIGYWGKLRAWRYRLPNWRGF